MTQFMKVYEPGDVVFEEGGVGSTFYYIQSGKVEVSKKSAAGPKVVDVMRAGQSFGEYALLKGGDSRRSATVTVLERAVLVELDGASLDEILRDVPGFILLLIKSLVNKVLEMENKLFDIQKRIDS
ncbi:MAG: cyclic nucleotide-binding domain-containing protein [Candidatus Glassbacteria bacterium]